MEKKDFFQLRHEILEGTPDSFFLYYLFFLFIFFFNELRQNFLFTCPVFPFSEQDIFSNSFNGTFCIQKIK